MFDFNRRKKRERGRWSDREIKVMSEQRVKWLLDGACSFGQATFPTLADSYLTRAYPSTSTLPPSSLSVSGMDVFGRSAAPARFCDDSEKFENYAGNAANDKRDFFTRQEETVLFFLRHVYLAYWKFPSWQYNWSSWTTWWLLVVQSKVDMTFLFFPG